MLHILSGRVRPLEKPEFSWILEGDEDQARYEVRIKDACGRIYWDSGEIAGGNRHNIVCGKALRDESIYTWDVRVTGSAGGTAEYQGGKICALGIGQQFGTENAILGQLIMENTDGHRTVVTTDEGVKWSEGALRLASL